MIKKIFSWVIVLLATISLSAQAQGQAPQGRPQPPRKASLEGIWQLCSFQKSDSGKYELHLAPVLKILSTDGHYQTVVIKTTAGGCVITDQGSYQKQGDTAYVQTPMQHPDDSTASQPQHVTYHLQGPQWMILDFKTKQSDAVSHEIWMRLRYQPNEAALLEELKRGQEGGDDRPMPRQMQRQPRGRRGQMRNMQQQQQQQQTTTTEEHSWMNED
jgi:hypothetical protein